MPDPKSKSVLDAGITWTTKKRKIGDLTAWEKNPRQISEEQMEQLKQSIKKFGYAAPVIANTNGRIVAGHMRIEAMKQMGMGEQSIDVRIPSRELTSDEADELSIRDNANAGDWDMDALANNWSMEELKDWGLDIKFKDQEDADEGAGDTKKKMNNYLILHFDNGEDWQNALSKLELEELSESDPDQPGEETVTGRIIPGKSVIDRL